MGSYETILYEANDGLAVLTMNRPEARNGMTTQMLRETQECLLAASRDPSLKVLMLTGAGDSFCPGADLRRATTPGVVDEPSYPHHYTVAALLHEMPAVTIAAVNGACAGAGFGWACGADIRVAARSAMFNTAFLNVAVAGDMGLPWSLPRLVGASKARELSFFSEKFDAEEAHRIGLVARVWDDAVFREEAMALAKRLAGAAPLALGTMKSHYLAAERMGFREFLALETEAHFRITRSKDTREAFAAFIEKRPPVFRGE